MQQYCHCIATQNPKQWLRTSEHYSYILLKITNVTLPGFVTCLENKWDFESESDGSCKGLIKLTQIAGLIPAGTKPNRHAHMAQKHTELYLTVSATLRYQTHSWGKNRLGKTDPYLSRPHYLQHTGPHIQTQKENWTNLYCTCTKCQNIITTNT